MQRDMAAYGVVFQSTLSVRRATGVIAEQRISLIISIHALREESDGHVALITPHGCLFQSTLSVRRATCRYAPHIRVPCDFNPRSP